MPSRGGRVIHDAGGDATGISIQPDIATDTELTIPTGYFAQSEDPIPLTLDHLLFDGTHSLSDFVSKSTGWIVVYEQNLQASSTRAPTLNSCSAIK